MNYLLKSGMITEQDDCHTLSYLLRDNGIFFRTGYKVLQSQADSGFVSCMLVSHNGKDKLVYDILGYRALASLLPDMPFSIFPYVAMSLVDAAMAAQENGFIQCQNIIVDIDHIYVDTGRYKVFLIYLPVLVPRQDVEKNSGEREQNVLGTAVYEVLVQVMDACCARWGRQADMLRRTLLASSHSLQGLKDILLEKCVSGTCREAHQMDEGRSAIDRAAYGMGDGFSGEESAVRRAGESGIGTEKILCCMDKDSAGKGGIYCLVGLNTEESFLLKPGRRSYLIGRSRESDCCLSGNQRISKKHCRIERRTDGLWLADAGSLNGTFVNNVAVKQGEGRLIAKGDIVRLADLLFCVEEK